jgi:3-oxoadipate enol-lactonase
MIEVESAGCRLSCRVDGPADRPALLLLNPLGTTRELWDAQAPAFAEDFRVIRCDARGHGRSGVPEGEYTIDQLGRDAIAVLDAFGVERAHVCGLSIGGLTAIWLGINAPDRLASLVLASTAARIGNAALWNERIRQVETTGLEDVADAAMTRWFTEPFRTTHPDVVATFRQMVAMSPPAGYIGCCAALRDADLREAIAAIESPTLVISGVEDKATSPADAEALRAGIRGARLITFDAAHLPNVELAGPFNARVLAFISASGGFRL